MSQRRIHEVAVQFSHCDPECIEPIPIPEDNEALCL